MLSPFPFSELHDWYKNNGRDNLPWREYNFDTKTLGYRVWLAETMLQQTQVERVKVYFENILKAFPTIEDLANCSYEDFFPYYKGLGYYSRARNMLKAANMIVEDFHGVFPDTTKDLVQLPGVGPYTAEAIRAFAYDLPTLSFDTNLEKIFSRYYFGNKFEKLKKQEKQEILEDFQKSEISARDINNALMDYGATVSLNNISGINWEQYPLTQSKFYQTRGELEPVKITKKSSFPIKKAHIFAILHKNHKVYFSSTTKLVSESTHTIFSLQEKGDYNKEFSPFYIGKNIGNPRIQIQEYFKNTFNLELSVRPPEIKAYNNRDIPYMICYCQIQSGTHTFQEFLGLKVRGFEEGFIEQIDFGENMSLF